MKHKYIDMLFVVVSETLITHTFLDVPRDNRVMSLVRENIRNYYADEGDHCAYFREFFAKAWPQLSCKYQRNLGRLLPAFILSFCEADYGSIGRSLRKVGLTEVEIDTIISDCYPSKEVANLAKRASVVSMLLFRNCGVLDTAETQDEFGKAGLI